MLYDVPPFEQRLLAFRHPLIQEVAYRSLLHERRREFHSKVAQAIENLFKDHAEERASLLAYHLEQAGENLKAAQQNMRAAVWIGANDPSQALRSWKKVRELLLDQPPVATDQLFEDDGLRPNRELWLAGRNLGGRTRMSISRKPSNWRWLCGDMRANALDPRRLRTDSGEWWFGRRVCRKRSAKPRRSPMQGNDASVQVTLKAVLCHALRLSGRMTEALQDEHRGNQAGPRNRKIRPADAGIRCRDLADRDARSNLGDARSKGKKPAHSSITSFNWKVARLMPSTTSFRVWRMWTSHGTREISDSARNMPIARFPSPSRAVTRTCGSMPRPVVVFRISSQASYLGHRGLVGRAQISLDRERPASKTSPASWQIWQMPTG